MRTLPYDSHRCKPTQPDSHCRDCLRRADMPGQTWGPRTPMTLRHNSTDEGCTYTPITEEGKA